MLKFKALIRCDNCFRGYSWISDTKKGIPTMKVINAKAKEAGFKKKNGKLLCPKCYQNGR